MKILKGLLLIAAVILVTNAANAEDKYLNLYSWDQYFDEQTLDGFTDETGYKVRYDKFPSDEMLETKLLVGSSGYDLVTPSATPFLHREIKAGAIGEFDPAKVPNLSLVDPALTKLLKTSDPEGTHGVIIGWGSTGMGINPDKVKEVLPDAPQNSYDLFFKPENAKALSKCGFVVVDSATDVVPLVLNYLGLDPNTENHEDIDKAIDVLEGIRPYLRYIESTKYLNDISQGTICAAIGWSGDFVQARNAALSAKNGVTVEYVVPKEGTLVWMTSMAIPIDAPDPDAGTAFMNYMLEPKVAAHLTEVSGYPGPVPEARKYLPAEVANDDAVFPSEETKKRLFVGGVQSEDTLNYMNREWTRFRTGS